jgi:hypothetical protein
MAFSEWLQEQLNFRKITGAELAERAGISKASGVLLPRRIAHTGAARGAEALRDAGST